MIKNEEFWEVESGAPLLNRNAGYIQRDNIDALLTRAREWSASVESRGPIVLSEWKTSCPHPESQRIFELDAERTFKATQHRQDLVQTLCTIYHHLHDYHQGMGFIVAFLLLFLNKKEVANLVVGLDRYYVEGYFKASPVAYVRDAKAFERILEKEFPKTHKHITSLLPAEAYCSKWFVGFNVHVLPFPALADFLDTFFRSNEYFRFQYAISLVKNTQHDILSTDNVGKILECLRLDSSSYPDTKTSSDPTLKDIPGSFFTQIINDAIEYNLDHIDLEHIRENVLKEMARENLRRQQREKELQASDDDEIVFSDEEDS